MCALWVPPVVPYKALENFSKGLCGTAGGACIARIFRPVMRDGLKKSYRVQAHVTFFCVTTTLHMKNRNNNNLILHKERPMCTSSTLTL